MPEAIDRRVFLSAVAAAASVGYAVLTQPATAAAITTDTTGITGGMVTLKASDGVDLPAYVAKPDHAGPYPVVLVVQEIFGLHDYIRDICRRLAKLGYMAIAGDLYVRQGDATKITDMDVLFSTIVNKVADDQVLADIDTTLAWALANGGDKDRVGITGFCWGGRQAWLYAEQRPTLKAAAAWYGLLGFAKPPLRPHNPIDLAAGLRVPTIGLYGGADKGIPIEQIEQLRKALKANPVDTDIIVYPGVGHAFHADYRPSYNEAAAKDAWAKMLAWFDAHGLKAS